MPETLTLEQRARLDSLCDRFERSWRDGPAIAIESLIAEADQSLRTELLRELVALELELNAARGRRPPLRAYVERFPQYRHLIMATYEDAAHQLDAAAATQAAPPSEKNKTPQPEDTYATIPHSGSGSGQNRLAVRCPNCRGTIDVAAESSLSDVVCSSCGSHLNLIDNAGATWVAPALTTMGRFELIDRVGVGGFGAVWKARDKELDRTVAVKIPRQGCMNAAEIEKFFREARTAAQLRHPNIVSVHEVGRQDDAVFIVSDFVRGVTLGDWSTGQQPTGRDAAQLCAKIADALHYAHEQGVVHRDLKPANIMIDGDGEPHLMDFGLARREVGEVTMTMDGQVIGTPAYMSPEQAQGESHTADRRSDIYSLGVILFQLLTGELPFRGNARMLMHQVIHDEPPSPRKFNASVRRDLETITLKCLEKEPGRRYQTAKEVADELRRFLAGEPISARPIGRVERGWRWCRRRPLVSSLAAGFVASILAAAAIAGYGYVSTSRALAEKEQAAATSDQVSKFLTELFRSSDPIGFASGDNFEFLARDTVAANPTARELLNRGAERIATELANQPAVQATLLETIGGVYRELGEYDRAAQMLKDALEKHLAITPVDPLRIAATRHNLGNLLYLTGDYDAAEEHLRAALASRRELLGEEHLETSSTLQSLSMVLALGDKFDEAEKLIDRAVEIRRKLQGNDHQGVAIALASKAAVALTEGKVEDAHPSIVEAVLIFAQYSGNSFAAEAVANYQRGLLANGQRKFEEGAKYLELTLDATRKTLGPGHPYVAFIESDYAVSLVGKGDYEAALEASKHALNIGELTTPRSPLVIQQRRQLANIYLILGRHDDARREIDRAVADTAAKYGFQSIQNAENLMERAIVLRECGQSGEALSDARIGCDIYRQLSAEARAGGAEEWKFRGELAECLLADGQPAEVVDMFHHAASESSTEADGSQLTGPAKLDALQLLGRALRMQDKAAEAEPLFRQGLTLAQKDKEQAAWAAWFRTLLADLFIDQGNLPKAIEQLTDAPDTLRKLKGPHHPWTKAADETLRAIHNDARTSGQ